MGIPGSITDGKIIFIEGYESFKDIKLEAAIKEKYGIPVLITNNMNALVYGLSEKMDCGEETVACVHIAETGPGCGIIVNGKVVNGFHGFAGEVGFMPLYGNQTLQKIASVYYS